MGNSETDAARWRFYGLALDDPYRIDLRGCRESDHAGVQNLGIVLTICLGIAGSIIATFLGQTVGWYAAGEGAGFIGSVVGALIVLFLYGKIMKK